jgi:transposase-like protein
MDETTTTELVPSYEKRDAAGRRIIDRARRGQLLAAYEQSGLTQAGFARQEGLNAQTFSTWVQERRRTSGVRPQPKPVQFAEMALGTTTMPGGLEVTLPDRTVIRGHEARAVAALVKALRG